MHKQRFNSLSLALTIIPDGPLLIKSGGLSIDPSLPDMQFVRTFYAGQDKEVLYIPGSSLKGVVRSFVEKALRTLDDHDTWKWACTTFPDNRAQTSCGDMLREEEQTEQVYARSCGACRVFGNTRLRGRASFTDFYPTGDIKTETRYGVAISRLSHAVAQGPFEMEVAVDGAFCGQLVLENYELWQLGLLAISINALNEGLLKIGFGKNRGFGKVKVRVDQAVIDEVMPLAGDDQLRGVASFMANRTNGEDMISAYGLAAETAISAIAQASATETIGFYQRRRYDADGWKAITRAAATVFA